MKYNFKGLNGQVGVGGYNEQVKHVDDNVNSTDVKDVSFNFSIEELEVELEANELPEIINAVKSIALESMKGSTERCKTRVDQNRSALDVEKQREKNLKLEIEQQKLRNK